MLRLDGLQTGYGASRVLFGMTFHVPEGSVMSLVGRNGMGKTTTVRAIMGLLPIRAGHVAVAGTSIAGLASHRIALLGAGLVPEGRRVFRSLTVEENLIATSRTTHGQRWTLGEVFALFPRLAERRTQPAQTLSGGEQQMLVIGRALMTNPRLLILDEATEGLAPIIRQEIWECLRRLKAEGLTILVIDKNLGEMATLVDRHHAIEKGRVCWTGSSAELAADPAVAHRYLGL